MIKKVGILCITLSWLFCPLQAREEFVLSQPSKYFSEEFCAFDTDPPRADDFALMIDMIQNCTEPLKKTSLKMILLVELKRKEMLLNSFLINKQGREQLKRMVKELQQTERFTK